MRIFIILFLVFLIVIGTSIVMMLTSLSKQDDEIRDFIINKSIKRTFIIIVGILIISACEPVYISLVKDISTEGINPFILLLITSIVFALELLFTKLNFENKH